ncbi:sugar transferase [Bacteroides nordii]|uniref:sugar transferase n=1 Tax=Bacteroides nordii TaxID=291645 RepID=UPI001896E40C|nr:sugar transferase [Bacteroides nordii]MCG4770775.1 sugar transferase [Bacteroides nordii]
MFLKFLFDRMIAFLGLLFLWPLLLIVTILIKIQMPGPVLFVQKRVGKGGEIFDCHKFRSMKLAHSGSTVSVAGESRITPLGSKLRRYKIDELPGLWDVLIGKMSFVGPRPDVPGYADQLKGPDRDVLKLRPGITGPASLKYRDEEEIIAKFVNKVKMRDSSILNLYRNTNFTEMTDEQIAIWYNDNIIYPDKVRINCYYYRNYSFVKDVQMIFATIIGKRILYAGEII